ncbi:SMI1/KNR4 family protein [Actinacidiphila glaucinigra]|uniref:SMI1/KNR4 family protein n=1 Tax=Actinacidiphila glaucinigra TaxID=235986 RepID=UPI0037CAF21E
MTDQETASVSTSWRRIDAWLATHSASAPALLNPPASRGEVAAAERALGVRFPGELVESLCCHNGVADWAALLPEGQSPLAVAAIVDHWRMCMQVASDVDGLTVPPWEDEPWWHPLWVPWAVGADGTAQVLDLRPGPGHGRLGWAGHGGSGDFSDAVPSLALYLHEVAEALHHGGGVRGMHPFLTSDGGLWWDEVADHPAAPDGGPLRAAPLGSG